MSYLLIIAACVLLTGCPTPMCLNPNPLYSFEVTAEFTPEKDSIRVGDTLYLVSEFPTTMVPIGGHEPIEYSNSLGLESVMGVLQLLENNKFKDAVYSFNYINIKGEIYNSKDIPSPARVQQLRFYEGSGNYQLKVGIIPREKGLFSLVLSNGLSNGRIKDKCNKASFNFSLSNTNTHTYLYDNWIGHNNEPLVNYRYLFKVY